ncbi:MAG: hypothetical protein WBI40_02520 [Methylococcaceae bacterium]
MNTDKNLIFLECNELSPFLLDKFIKQGILPNFKKFYEASEIFTTITDVSEPDVLEPWIQWYSIHTGLSYEQHNVFRLTDGAYAEHEDLWQVLQKNGRTVGNFSSMNVRRGNPPGNFFVPDPWCSNQNPYPENIGPFYNFISDMVKEYSNPNKNFDIKNYLNIGLFLLKNGLSLNTVSMAVQQLFLDKLIDKKETWRRASVLDSILFDVFVSLYKSSTPNYSTFFMNSVAHYQHAYWRCMEPEKFVVQPSDEELARFKNAIQFGYQKMDDLIGRAFQLEKQGATLVLVSALGQQPFLRKESAGGQLFYRPKNTNELLKSLGIVSYKELEPTMTHQFKIRFFDKTSAVAAKQSLESLVCNNRNLFAVFLEGDSDLYFDCQVSTSVSDDCKITFSQSGKSISFFSLMYQIDGMKSGCHHPDGVLWFKTGKHRVHNEKVSILDIFPTVLDYFSVENNFNDRLGQSLISKIA